MAVFERCYGLTGTSSLQNIVIQQNKRLIKVDRLIVTCCNVYIMILLLVLCYILRIIVGSDC